MKKRRKEPETLREHCRHIFGDEPPVLCVWETEFDYADAELKALAAKEWQQISERDLSAYYVLNLVYNEPMQIELFRYLFPLCLAQWHETVLAGGYGDHFEESLMKALCRPYLWQEMMNASQRQQVRQFLLDTALQRMDNERGFNNVLCWLAVFNTLGGAAPLIRSLVALVGAGYARKSGVCYSVCRASNLSHRSQSVMVARMDRLGASIRP